MAPTTARRVTALVVAGATALALLLVPAAPAAAASCPEAEVVFARGRLEPPGIGKIGSALVSALRARLPEKNIGVYAVRYDADADVLGGANDMSAHVQYLVTNCPDTRQVLGGYSLGAAVTDVVLALPNSMFGLNNPLPPGTDGHIAAVALFGNGSAWAGPITNLSPTYSGRAIELCHGADPICNPADPRTWQNNWSDHLADAYLGAGMANQAADFVAGRL